MWSVTYKEYQPPVPGIPPVHRPVLTNEFGTVLEYLHGNRERVLSISYKSALICFEFKATKFDADGVDRLDHYEVWFSNVKQVRDLDGDVINQIKMDISTALLAWPLDALEKGVPVSRVIFV
jgi:hypothetical protein